MLKIQDSDIVTYRENYSRRLLDTTFLGTTFFLVFFVWDVNLARRLV